MGALSGDAARLTPVKEWGKEGGLGRKRLRFQQTSEKVLAKLMLPVKGVSCLQ